MTKEEALTKLSKIPHVKDEEVKPILAQLDLTEEEFKRLLQPPHKTFLDYKSYYKIFNKFKLFIKILTKANLIQEFIYQCYFLH